MGSME